MSKNKKKVKKLTDAQYIAYIAALRDDPASYNPDGHQYVPEEIYPHGKEKKQGD